MRVAVFSSKPYDQAYLDAANAGRHELVYLTPHLTAQTLVLASGCQAVCCFVNDQLNAEVLAGLAGLSIQYVVLRCAGFNQLDGAAAAQLNITVARVPEYSPYAVAEHTTGLILALNRNIHRAHNRIRENDYSLQGLMGFDLHGKTVGVIGGGKIGLALCRIMQGFGCKILISDPVENAELKTLGTYVTLDHLLAAANIVSLHCPLTPATKHIINAQSLAAMQPGAMLINTSRGALVDASAVIDALKTGHLGYFGLDVYEEEADLFFEDLSNQVIQDDVFARLTTFPNVLITGHQAFFTHEAMSKIAEVTLANLQAFADGVPTKAQLINPPPR